MATYTPEIDDGCLTIAKFERALRQFEEETMAKKKRKKRVTQGPSPQGPSMTQLLTDDLKGMWRHSRDLYSGFGLSISLPTAPESLRLSPAYKFTGTRTKLVDQMNQKIDEAWRAGKAKGQEDARIDAKGTADAKLRKSEEHLRRINRAVASAVTDLMGIVEHNEVPNA